MDERVKIIWPDVLARLRITPDYDPGGDCVHTFMDGPFLTGAYWRLSEVEDAVKTYGCELAGETATNMHHGLVIMDYKCPGAHVFLETLS